jgi:hypothetical protein
MTAGPDATCASESSLRSLNGNRSVTMTLQNLSNEPISAFWLDYAGKRVFYHRLNGGESYAQPTYISHPWVFVDANGPQDRDAEHIPESRRDPLNARLTAPRTATDTAGRTAHR